MNKNFSKSFIQNIAISIKYKIFDYFLETLACDKNTKIFNNSGLSLPCSFKEELFSKKSEEIEKRDRKKRRVADTNFNNKEKSEDLIPLKKKRAK